MNIAQIVTSQIGTIRDRMLPNRLEAIGRELGRRIPINLATGLLLKGMALKFSAQPRLRRLLETVDGYHNFSVGFATESGSVAQCIVFDNGSVYATSGLPSTCTVVMRFANEETLASLLSTTPNELLHLILRNELVAEGNLTYLQLFNYLLGAVLGDRHHQLRKAANEQERECRNISSNTASSPTPTSATRLKERSHYRLPSPIERDPGVLHLPDPYLSSYELSCFPRLARFLDDHLSRKAKVCDERARVMTTWFRQHGFETRSDGQPWDGVERQGRVLKHFLEHKRPVIREDDLLAGSTTEDPCAGATVFPEAQGTLIWGELASIHERFMIPFDIAPDTIRRLHRDIFPFWAERNFREWVRREHDSPLSLEIDQRWVAYFVWKSVGISHTIPNFEGILQYGTAAMIEKLREALDDSNPETQLDQEGRTTIGAMVDVLEGLTTYATHLSAEASRQAESATPERARELRRMAKICKRVPRLGARTLHEALMSVWLAWVALHNENADTGLSLGRLDQILQPYLDADLSKLKSTGGKNKAIERAIELVGCFFMRCTDHFPLSPDLGNYLFGGASSTQALTLGGVTPDGKDAVNDMTYIMLKVTEMLSIRDVNVNARFKRDVNSRAYLERLCEVNIITAGTPSMHSDDAVFASLAPHGYPKSSIRNWSATGCVEPTLSGEHMGHTGSILMNLVAAMEMVMNDGYHPIMRMDIGPKTGLPGADDFSDFESFFQAYKQQLACLIGNAVDLNNRLAAIHAKYRPTPLLSALMEGPADAGRDVTRGGARYNSSGTSNIGLADVTDSLLVIKKLVFDDQQMSFANLAEAVRTNFANDPKILAMVKTRVPYFGSGNPEALAMANRVAALVKQTYADHRNYRGGPYTTGFWSMSQHVAYGSLTGAIASGRVASKAFTPGLTPQPGASKSFLDNIRDVAHLDPTSMDNNMAFNVKLTPCAHDSREKTVGIMAAYVDTYFATGGMQIQFNVVTSETLKEAMANPDAFRGLLVRISGYNAYFVTLNRELQQELIERSEFGA